MLLFSFAVIAVEVLPAQHKNKLVQKFKKLMNKQNWHSNGFALMMGLMLLLTVPALAQDKQKAKEEEAAYTEVVKERAEKIVVTLGVTDPSQGIRVRDIIAQQYRNLRDIQGSRDAEIEKAKKKAGDNKEATAKRTKAIEQKTDAKIARLHTKYLSRLSAELSAEQVEQVKDGMTYNVVPITYRNYLLMLPYLSGEQQETIKSFLVEAREYAMDGGSSKEKHAWFGNYKGKITNYLAAQGFDLKKEGANWAERRNTNSDVLEIAQSNRVAGTLRLTDDIQKEHVRNLIALQYQRVQEIQEERDAKMDATTQLPKSKEERDKEAADIWAKYQVYFASQRNLFFQTLSAFIDSSQVETVKNEMTDNRLQEEYSHFLALLPGLKDDQKKQVYSYLLEARDNAMNVLDEKGRLNWFIKFRGRANNYLSREGYNLRKATEDLEKRLFVEREGQQ
ncbi:DUF3826 domain-containing protein [Pontibacter qinzhouensis]|uniref:DUF3826 domain-containing protein n=1 Tax=Pontibacter qinzhouensis TaxID=2603253 RepID=UPI00164FFFB4|nr:DUF3826 domain-containing protein [Pontibacter qinzhouensis]